mgnify:CR=1 FL=1
MLSVGISDFCYIGPQRVMTADNADNAYVAYYLRCEGENPLDYDVSALPHLFVRNSSLAQQHASLPYHCHKKAPAAALSEAGDGDGVQA